MNEELTPNETKVDTTIAIYNGASTLKITEDEQVKLLASFDEAQIEIRPDGLIYLPQTFWRKRLNESFGIGQWCLVVKNSFKDPDTSKDKLYVEGILMARGCYLATAVGEAELHSDNPLQSWASVFESAKSDCITRCCKDLSIASELWQPEYTRNWVAKNAVKVFIEKKGGGKGVSWRKKTSAPFWNETGIVPSNDSASDNNNQSQERKPAAVANEKPWLNKWTSKAQTETTKQWKNTIEALMRTEKPVTMEGIEAVYRLNKEVKAELEQIAKTQKKQPNE